MSALKAVTDACELQWRMIKLDVKAYRDAMRMSHYTSLDTRDLERSSRYWFKKFQSACMYLEALRAEANLLKRIKDA